MSGGRNPITDAPTIRIEKRRKIALTRGALKLQQLLLKGQQDECDGKTKVSHGARLLQMLDGYESSSDDDDTDSVMQEAWNCQDVLMKEGVIKQGVLEEVMESIESDSVEDNDNIGDDESFTTIEDEPEQPCPPGHTRDEIRGGWRRRLMVDDCEGAKRAMLRRKWDALCENKKEERAMRWVDGDSELDFSEWEEVNKKRQRRLRRKG